MFAVSLLVCLAACLQGSAGSDHWSYSGHSGPSHWYTTAKECGGHKQSPINIMTTNVVRQDLPTITFKNYNKKPRDMMVTNNGHSASVGVTTAVAPSISDGGLGGEYVFAAFHFHWGKDSSMGSEHTINSVSYPMEMHFVHYKKEYGSVSEAVNKKDGLAVLGVTFKISQTDNPAYTPLVNALKEITDAEGKAKLSAPYPLSAFMPRNLRSFYRYQGSLTTPTCNEVVTWTLFEESVEISEAQMEVFRSLQFSDQTALVDNFRPTQALHGRKVLASFDAAGSDASATKGMGLAVTLMASAAVLLTHL